MATTGSYLTDLLDTIVERGRALMGRRGEGRPIVGTDAWREALDQLLSGRGEASGVAIAKDVITALDKATDAERRVFLKLLAERYGPDDKKLSGAVEAWLRNPSQKTASALHIAAEPRRQEVIRRLNRAPGGTFALVKLRETLLAAKDDALDVVDDDFGHLFSSWFNRGFLVLRPIDWSTPAAILDKIVAYEAVHAISDWNDLKNRLAPSDRRCFGFFHPRLADEPLIFVEVALTRAIPDAVQPLLATRRAHLPATEATTAVFYSISNCQQGLAGISFGNFLIKQVVEELKKELPGLSTFVTLSPVPAFADWLAAERKKPTSTFVQPADKDVLRLLDVEGWHLDERIAEKLKPVLLALAAAYFTQAKRSSGRPVDPVARFHLGNGARLERLNFLGDTSPKGLAQSHGLMVNYLYDLPTIVANHEAFAEKGEVVTQAAVRKLVRAMPRAPARSEG